MLTDKDTITGRRMTTQREIVIAIAIACLFVLAFCAVIAIGVWWELRNPVCVNFHGPWKDANGMIKGTGLCVCTTEPMESGPFQRWNIAPSNPSISPFGGNEAPSSPGRIGR